MGFELADVLEVHAEFFNAIAGEREDEGALVGEQTTVCC
jgi:hypothetical protein